MRILVVGNGGREHALAWKLSHNPTVDRIFAAPGNPGMAEIATLADLRVTDVPGIAVFAEENNIDLTVVGPEAPLAAGLADELASRGLRVFGPSAAAAHIEASKSYCREIAGRYGVPMAEGLSFDDPTAASDYAKTIQPPVVVKADGLAAGKGVIICEDHDRARDTIDDIMRGRRFGDAGNRVVVEECLVGREISLLALTDGDAIVSLDVAQDFKRIGDGDTGPNTGGMGAYSPVRWLSDEIHTQAVRDIVEPLVHGLAEEGRDYVGCFYAGLMITDKGPKLIEVNCRFGDPETQVLLPRWSSDFMEAVLACVEGNLRDYRVGWRREACVCVGVAAEGYPGEPRTGMAIEGLDEVSQLRDVIVFHAGTAKDGARIVASGGRVLNVCALGRTIEAARRRAYDAVGRIRMDGMQYRTDIAKE